MSVFSASSLSTSDIAFNRRVKPLPKRRRPSFPSSEGDGRRSLTNTFYAPPHHRSINTVTNGTDNFKSKLNTTPSHPRLITKPSSLPSRPRITDDADGDGDYTDHLQQPNNTKKRKVPAATVAPASHERTDKQDHDDLDNENAPKLLMNPSGKAFGGAGPGLDPRELDFQLTAAPRRKPCSPITLATLRLKELFNTRLAMMAAAIRDDVSPLALQFALSAPVACPPAKQLLRAWSYGPKFRRRPCSRLPSIPQQEPWFSGQFTFSTPSPISKRYIVAKKVAAGLKTRFQMELARQATSAAEMAPKTTSKFSSDPSSREKRATESSPVLVPSSGPSANKVVKKSKKSKKKKRSALANASNPHHLRNYVPSRVLQGGHPAPTTHNQSQTSNSLGPLALKFLSATLPPRRKGRAPGPDTLGPSLVRPESEWICPFCEYSLFYSNDDAMHRAVKNRRRTLARRRKARERAAAAASGVAPQSQDVSEDDAESDEDDGEGDDSFDEDSNVVPAFTTSRRGIGTAGARQGTHGSHPGG